MTYPSNPHSNNLKAIPIKPNSIPIGNTTIIKAKNNLKSGLYPKDESSNILLPSIRSVIKRATHLGAKILGLLNHYVCEGALYGVLLEIAAIGITVCILAVCVAVGLCCIGPNLARVWVDALGVCCALVISILRNYGRTLLNIEGIRLSICQGR